MILYDFILLKTTTLKNTASGLDGGIGNTRNLPTRKQLHWQNLCPLTNLESCSPLKADYFQGKA